MIPNFMREKDVKKTRNQHRQTYVAEAALLRSEVASLIPSNSSVIQLMASGKVEVKS